MRSPSDSMGFPPGIAKKHVLAAYKKYELLAGNTKKSEKPEMPVDHVPAAVEQLPGIAYVEEVVTTPSQDTAAASDSKPETESRDNASANDRSSSNTTVAFSAPQTSTVCSSGSVLAANTSDTQDSRPELSAEDKSTVSSTLTAANDEKSNADADDDNPELTLQQKTFQLNPESYNGAVRDNYSWSQSITDVDVRVEVPPHIQRGSDVTVQIARKHLRVAYKDADGQLVDVVDGELVWDIHKDESLWSLVPGEHVHINLEKVQERWWEAVLSDEPKISVRKIDASRPITDLDDEAQAKIEELMYNENQKRLGLPQSHEQKVHDILRQAWDAEGSPFKGQPFDPSVVNVSPGGM